MDDPVHRHLRPANGSGLTSPDQVRTLHGQTAAQPQPDNPGHRTSRKTSERRAGNAHFTVMNTKRPQRQPTLLAG
jgi:hypothetical protein